MGQNTHMGKHATYRVKESYSQKLIPISCNLNHGILMDKNFKTAFSVRGAKATSKYNKAKRP